MVTGAAVDNALVFVDIHSQSRADSDRHMRSDVHTQHTRTHTFPNLVPKQVKELCSSLLQHQKCTLNLTLWYRLYALCKMI